MAIVPDSMEEFTRLIAAACLSRNTLAQDRVYAPGDWPTDPQAGYAEIQIGRDVQEEKVSVLRGQPSFTTTCFITVDGRLARQTGEEALAAINRLRQEILQAVLTDIELNSRLQQFSAVRTKQEVASDSGLHVGQVTLQFALEYFQSQEDYTMPADPAALSTIALNFDAVRPYDASATYANTPVTDNFPAAVVSAPRATGPDGRDEGYIQIDLPQT